MSRPAPRRPASSRGSTPRPRKIAGQAGGGRAEDRPVEDSPGVPAAKSGPEKVDLAKTRRRPGVRSTTTLTDRERPASAGAPAGAGARTGILARQKTTRVLIATLVLVTLALAAEFGVLLWKSLSDDDVAPPTDGNGTLTVPEGRPVVADELPVLEGVDKAAKAAQEIVAIDYKAYDDEVDKAAELMTASFEKSYRTTTADIEKDFVANKTTVQANVVAQGVVRANRTRLEALVFLNQVVSRERDGKPETVVTPYKVLVTMVHTDQGWFVDGLDTDADQDKTN